MTGLPPPSALLGVPGFSDWYPGQREAFSEIMDWYYSPVRFLGVSLPTGCHAKGQGILMYDGSIKKVEDVIVGDKLMGMDSSPRRVLVLHRGIGDMYKVCPVKGTPFVVNADHILTLVRTNEKSKDNTSKWVKSKLGGTLVDVSVRDWLKWSKTHKHIHKLFRVAVSFLGIRPDLPLSPYVLGILLGNGCMTPVGRVEVDDTHCIPELFQEATRIGSRVVIYSAPNKTSHLFRLNGPGKRKKSPFAVILGNLGLMGKNAYGKFVPQEYKVASRLNRLEMLAGLMDTDGHATKGFGYDYVSASKRLADDVAYLCRSVGLAAYVQPCVKGCQNGFVGNYYRVSISGNCEIIPSRYKPTTVRKQKKSVLRTGFHTESVGIGDYYGFTLNGDGRYLLDDFTVAHNSGKSVLSVLLAVLSGTRACILTATKGLQSQLINDFGSIAVKVQGQNNFRCTLVPTLTAEEGPCHEGLSCSYSRTGNCPYREQLKEALEARIVITNYAYYLAQTRFSSGLGEYGILVGDEAHLAFSALENHLDIHLSKMDVQSLGVDFPSLPTTDVFPAKKKGKKSTVEDTAGDAPTASPPDLWALWQSWASCSTPVVQENVDRLSAEIQSLHTAGHPVPGQLSRAYRMGKSVLAKINNLSTASGDWVIQKTNHGYLFTPRWVSGYGSVLFGEVPKIMLMSAILSHKTADSIGVPTGEDRAWLEVGSYFPPENTPIWHIPTTRVNYRSDDYSAVIWQSRIDQIIQRRLDRKGIVFTVSYERARLLLSRSRFKDIMLTHSTGDVTMVVNRFKQMKAPAVLVSPSVTTGYDFPAELYNIKYIIVGKVPYPDTKDPVMEARRRDDSDWPSYMAMDTLIQETGRATRSDTDRCEVLIIDDNFWSWFWPKYREFSPKWFRDRVRGSLSSVPPPLV